MKIDEVGYWSELKLEIIKKYAGAYSKILAAQKSSLEHHYIDAFAGAGIHLSRRTGEFILGSPLNALNIDPPFQHHHLIDLDGERVDYLREITKYEGDCNTVLLGKVFPKVRYEDYRRALCILDPYRLNPDWKGCCEGRRNEIRGNIPEFYGNGHEHECAVEKSECCLGRAD